MLRLAFGHLLLEGMLADLDLEDLPDKEPVLLPEPLRAWKRAVRIDSLQVSLWSHAFMGVGKNIEGHSCACGFYSHP